MIFANAKFRCGLFRLGVLFSTLVWCFVANAAATAVAVSGSVTVAPKVGDTGPMAEGQRIEAGALITTGANGTTTIRFDDGQLVALSVNTAYSLSLFRFNPHKPKEGSIAASLLRGGLRTVTGIIGKSNPDEVKIKTSVATVGIRGTDFQLYLDSRLHFHVLEGVIGVSNQAGEELFSPKTEPTGLVNSFGDKATPIRYVDLPADAQGSFRQLEANSIVGNKPSNPNDPTCADRR